MGVDEIAFEDDGDDYLAMKKKKKHSNGVRLGALQKEALYGLFLANNVSFYLFGKMFIG